MKSTLQLRQLSESKKINIIDALSSDSDIFYKLGEILEDMREIGPGTWFELKERSGESNELRKQRMRTLLNAVQHITGSDLVNALCKINQFDCATIVSDSFNIARPQQPAITEPNQKKVTRKYETVNDILSDEDNFGLIVMNLYLKLDSIWPFSAGAFIDAGIDINIDQNTISQKTMQGKFYLESIRNIKLTDFLSNLDSIECSTLVKDIDNKLSSLSASIVREKKESFSGKNEVAKWCTDNNLSYLYDQLLNLGFDSLSKLKQLDDQTCTEIGIKDFPRIELMKKITLIP